MVMRLFSYTKHAFALGSREVYKVRQLSSLSPSIRELLHSPATEGSTISAQGHIKTIRQFKNVGFIDLSDGSTFQPLSVIIKCPEQVLSGSKYKLGQSIRVKGQWLESQGQQSFEIQYDPEQKDHSIDIIGNVPDDYPLQKKTQSYPFLRALPVLRHRTSSLASILRFRSFLENYLFEFFNKNGFVKVSPPIITGTDCEGAGEQFQVDSPKDLESKRDDKTYFYGKPTYLTVSAQLHLEVLALSFNRVWSLAPCFRAEDSNTNRHLSEFWMLEGEMCYVDTVKEMTDFVEKMIRYVTARLLDVSHENKIGSGQDLLMSRYKAADREQLKQRWSSILSTNSWPSITYNEALCIINEVKNKGRLKNRLHWGDSIQTEHEKWIAGSYFQSPVFVTDYPAAQKPFYMAKSHASIYNEEQPTVACFDLLLPDIGELVGGSLRESDYSSLVQSMKNRDMKLEEMDWFLSTRLNGSVPHGGFGMGFERLLSYLSMMDNIREVIPFPRASQSCIC